MRKKGQLMRDSLKARMAAILAASGLLVAAPVVLVQGASAQSNDCPSTVLTGGIGNHAGNGSESDTDASCSAEGTSISQVGDNANVGVQIGDIGVALCGSTAGTTGNNVCPVVQGDVEQEQEQNAGHQAEAYTGGSKKGKKGKKARKKSKRH
jgi:hypothetical protein